MANFCTLCNAKLSIFGTKSLICGNDEELFCADCHAKLYDMPPVKRGRYVLDHGKPTNADNIRVYVERQEAEQHLLDTYEPEQRPCPACGGTMTRKMKDFCIGADGKGGLDLLGFYQQYSVDLYACDDCGKVELYTSNFAAVKARQARKAELEKQQEQTTRSNSRPGEKPPWEK